MPGIDVIALGQTQVGDVTVARRVHLAARQVDLRDLGLGLCFTQFTTGDTGIDLRVFTQLGADRLGSEAGTPAGFAFAQVQLLLAGLHHRLGFFQRGFEPVAVDAQQHIPRLHLLVVVSVEFTHPTRHIRGDHHHVGANPRVAGPGGEHVVLPQMHAGKNRHRHQAQGYRDTYGGTHVQLLIKVRGRR
ncbi:hypothetical protein D3C84_617930 [compost metagenome]